MNFSKRPLAVVASIFALGAAGANADQVFLDDLIVNGSACIGQDCVNGESFGFDTIRIKENNVRIKFEDTSTSASFPSNDWQLTANASSNGGGNYFAIDDVSGGRTPFLVEAAAPTNALYIEDSGEVGFGTSLPVVELHVVDGDTPTLRLEQDGSSGFTPQTWDLAGNETNFFVRDVSNNSQLPFRIRVGADSDSLYVNNNNTIGLGTSSPSTSLHITTLVADEAVIRVENGTNGWDIGHNIVQGNHNFAIRDADTGAVGFQLGTDGTLKVGDFSDGNVELEVSGTTGDATFRGNVTALNITNTSSKTMKENFSQVDAEAVLASVNDMEIMRWSYIHDQGQTFHVGPMAEDFYGQFGLGADERHIATVDSDGIALASIQALSRKLIKKEERIELLEAQLQQLNSKVDALVEAK